MDNYTLYMHVNKLNNKKYIGITKLNPIDRWRNGKGYKNQYFYRAIKKYDWDNFEHVIILDSITYEEACKKEIDLIKEYNTTNKKYGYNIEYGGNSKKTVSDKTKEKLSIAITGMFSGERHYNYGKQLSDITKQKISKAHINLKHTNDTKEKISKWYKDNSKGELNHFYGKHHTDESKQKISKANKINKTGENNPMYGKYGKEHHNSKQILCITTGEIFDSISDAARHYKLNPSNIVSCCKEKRKSTGKTIDGDILTWKYV